MSNFSDVLNFALAIVAIATLAGLGLLRGTVQNLREQLRDERDNATSMRVQRDEDHLLITRLRGDLDALSRVVTGEAHWIAVEQLLDEHHKHMSEHVQSHNVAAVDHWQAERALLAAIRDGIAELRRAGL